MKIVSVITLSSVLILAGCGKKEEPASSIADATPETAPVEQAQQPEAPVENIQAELSNKVEEVVKTVKESIPDLEEVASSVDWANLSWNKVSEIPYSDKDALITWATPQINELKETLTKAAMDKGISGLASLGDSGWQGAIKSAVEALDTVRNSSPETWEMARGALISAWDMLQTEAAKYIGDS